ncbi:MAG: apolipoprotein N-acyltransferase, partial [Armatimonadetes bacterium]|nr:apolipoprotein N-acyltransferase [Armatimonadota bacterium]
MVEYGGRYSLDWRYAIAIAIVSGVAVALSFFAGIWWWSLFALSPVLALVCSTKSNLKLTVFAIWLCALTIHALLNMPLVPTIISVRSIVHLSPFAAAFLSILAWLGLAATQSAFFVPVGVVSYLLINRLGAIWFVLGCACSWTLFEWVRSLGIMGYQWGCIAYALLPSLELLQPAEFIGIYGLCFLIVAINGAFAISLERALKGNWLFGICGGALCIAFALGWFCFGGWLIERRTKQLQDDKAWRSLPVAIIQGNISWREKQSPNGVERAFELHSAMTEASVKHHPKVIAWAETAIPAPLNEWDKAMSALKLLSERSYADMLIGAVESEQSSGKVYNACYGVASGGKFMGTYRKLRLVPFGEFVPLRNRIKLLERIAAHERDFSHGERVEPLRLHNISAAVAICFDSLFPWVTRLQVKGGANAIVIITNDEWFWGSWMAKHHAAVAKLRAIECRLYVIRAANSGVSCIVDPVGRIVAELPLRQRRTMHGAVCIPDKHLMTVYVRFGDLII